MPNKKRPATGDRRPATGDRRPATATGDRRPATGDRRPATGDRRPATGDRRPATGDRRPATGDRRPAGILSARSKPEGKWVRAIHTGDNLDILRAMPDRCVDLVYLDPPFNKNRNFAAPIGSKAAGAAFKDTWTLDDVDLAWHGEIAEEHPGLYQTIDAAGTAHSKGMKAYLIYMAVRLLELRRVMKATASVYLHCDPTASHYLKALMDSVFGHKAFRTEITWKRGSAHSDTKQGRRQHGRIHDVLLYYSVGKKWTWNPVHTEYDQEYIDAFYRHKDADGRRWRKGDLTAAKPGGDTKYEWRVKRQHGGEWEADLTDEWTRPLAGWEYRGVPPYKSRYWAYSREKMRRFAEQGRLSYAKTGMPNYKRYLDEMPGVPLQDLWSDIPFALGKQRTGYPTQKPLALLDRIIRSSSNGGGSGT